MVHTVAMTIFQCNDARCNSTLWTDYQQPEVDAPAAPVFNFTADLRFLVEGDYDVGAESAARGAEEDEISTALTQPMTGKGSRHIYG